MENDLSLWVGAVDVKRVRLTGHHPCWVQEITGDSECLSQRIVRSELCIRKTSLATSTGRIKRSHQRLTANDQHEIEKAEPAERQRLSPSVEGVSQNAQIRFKTTPTSFCFVSPLHNFFLSLTSLFISPSPSFPPEDSLNFC